MSPLKAFDAKAQGWPLIAAESGVHADSNCHGDSGICSRAGGDSQFFSVRQLNRPASAGRCENIYLAVIGMKGTI